MPQLYTVKLDSSMYGEIYHIAAAHVAMTRPWNNVAIPLYNLNVNASAGTDEQKAFLTFANVNFTSSGTPTLPLSDTTKKVTDCIQEEGTPHVSEIQEHILKTMLGFEYGALTQEEKNTLKNDFMAFIQEQYALPTTDRKFILRIRNKGPKDTSAYRNISTAGVKQILDTIHAQNPTAPASVILLGDALPIDTHPGITIYDLRNFYEQETFINLSERFGKYNNLTPNTIAAQLFFQKVLQERFRVVAAIGMKSGALDGPAFYGLLTIFFCPKKGKNRMQNAAAVIPSFHAILYCDDAYNHKGKQHQKFSQEILTELHNKLPKNLLQTAVGIFSTGVDTITTHPKTSFSLSSAPLFAGVAIENSTVTMLGYLTLIIILFLLAKMNIKISSSKNMMKSHK